MCDNSKSHLQNVKNGKCKNRSRSRNKPFLYSNPPFHIKRISLLTLSHPTHSLLFIVYLLQLFFLLRLFFSTAHSVLIRWRWQKIIFSAALITRKRLVPVAEKKSCAHTYICLTYSHSAHRNGKKREIQHRQ